MGLVAKAGHPQVNKFYNGFAVTLRASLLYRLRDAATFSLSITCAAIQNKETARSRLWPTPADSHRIRDQAAGAMLRASRTRIFSDREAANLG